MIIFFSGQSDMAIAAQYLTVGRIPRVPAVRESDAVMHFQFSGSCRNTRNENLPFAAWSAGTAPTCSPSMCRDACSSAPYPQFAGGIDQNAVLPGHAAMIPPRSIGQFGPGFLTSIYPVRGCRSRLASDHGIRDCKWTRRKVRVSFSACAMSTRGSEKLRTSAPAVFSGLPTLRNVHAASARRALIKEVLALSLNPYSESAAKASTRGSLP